MKKIKYLLVAFILLNFTFAKVSAMEKELPSGIKYNEIESKINEFIENHKETTVGLSVAIYDKDETLYQNNYGYIDKENKIKVNEESVFEWGSTSKLFIWISLMQLEEQGKIDFNKDINEYLPEYFLKNRVYDDKITIIDLMNHQAGFQEFYIGTQTINIDNVISLKDALSNHQPKQIYRPREVTAYSNWGAALAAYIVENVSGMDYKGYVHKNIFDVIGMDHTSIGAKAEDNEWVNKKWKSLKYYDLDGKLMDLGKQYIILYPAGMGIGTMSDFLKFAKAITPTEEKCVLFQKDDTLDKMYTATSFFGDLDVASNYHGFFSSQYKVETIGHGGNTFGSSAMLQFNKETGIGMVVFVNQAHEQVYNYQMYDLVFGKFTDSKLARIKRDVPKGLASSTRIIKRGPLSIITPLSLTGFEEEDLEVWWYQDGNHVYTGYGDYIIDTPQVIINLILIFLFVISASYSFITIVFSGVFINIIKIIKHKKIDIKSKKWNYITNIFNVLIFIINTIMLLKLSNGTMTGDMGSYFEYELISIFTLIFSLVLIGLIIYKIIKKIKYKYNNVTIVFTIITLINIIVYELYAFWLI